MSGIVLTTVIGRVSEPKLVSNGKAIRMGVPIRIKDDKVFWHEVIVWDSCESFDFVKKYVKKGSSVIVSGVMKENSFTDKDGNTRVAYETRAHSVNFPPSNAKKEGGESGYSSPKVSEPVDEVLDSVMYEPNDEDVPF